MSIDETKKAMRGDGFKSRKFIATMATLAVTWSTATIAWLALDRMEAAEWVSFCQWVIPLVLATYKASNVLEKFAVAKASNGG